MQELLTTGGGLDNPVTRDGPTTVVPHVDSGGVGDHLVDNQEEKAHTAVCQIPPSWVAEALVMIAWSSIRRQKRTLLSTTTSVLFAKLRCRRGDYGQKWGTHHSNTSGGVRCSFAWQSFRSSLESSFTSLCIHGAFYAVQARLEAHGMRQREDWLCVAMRLVSSRRWDCREKPSEDGEEGQLTPEAGKRQRSTNRPRARVVYNKRSCARGSRGRLPGKDLDCSTSVVCSRRPEQNHFRVGSLSSGSSCRQRLRRKRNNGSRAMGGMV